MQISAYGILIKDSQLIKYIFDGKPIFNTLKPREKCG